MRELQQAVQYLNNLPFPRGEHVSDLYADLVEFDGYINGLLQQVLHGKSPNHQLERDPKLRLKLEHACSSESHGARNDAKKLLAYLDVLERTIDIAGQIHW